jgi:hypothetical protein
MRAPSLPTAAAAGRPFRLVRPGGVRASTGLGILSAARRCAPLPARRGRTFNSVGMFFATYIVPLVGSTALFPQLAPPLCPGSNRAPHWRREQLFATV